jgi:hypothetical protein
VRAETLDAGDAVMERSRINHEYQFELNALRTQQEQAYRALDDRRKPARDGSSKGYGPATPRLPSQSVVTYPQDGEPAPAETTQPGDRHKNVGFGTRELEF